MALLEAVAESPDPLSATAIAERTSFPLSTVSRLLNQLTDEGLLLRPGNDATYVLGARIIQLARRGVDRFSLPVVAQPILDRLRDELQETVSLHVKTQSLRVCIASAQSRQQVARIVPVGQSMPILPAATGEVLLSNTTGGELARILESTPELDSATELTRLAQTRERGWSIISNDAMIGLTAIAVGVKDAQGRTVAALSCSGPSVRFKVEQGSAAFDAVIEAARKISELLELSL